MRLYIAIAVMVLIDQPEPVNKSVETTEEYFRHICDFNKLITITACLYIQVSVK